MRNLRFIEAVTVAALLMAALGLTSPVNASEWQHQKIYAGLGVSFSDISVNQSNIISANNLAADAAISTDGFGYQIFTGFKLDQHLSLELGLIDLGTLSVQDSTGKHQLASVDSLYMDVLLRRAVTQHTDAFVRLGISSWEIQNASDSVIASGDDFHYGLGLDINLYGSADRKMRIEWTRQSFDGVTLEDADTISASLVIEF